MNNDRPGAPRTRHRLLVLPAIGLGLLSSIGATKCAADQPETSAASAKKATGSVVRCHGARSCDIVFRRATTERFVEGLRGRTPSTAGATAIAEAACLLATHSLATHIVCAAGSSLLSEQLGTALRHASAAKECLTIHLQAPDGSGPWRPISYDTVGGRDCAA